jgi:proteasome lid subunit RPN8/RPN11
MNELIFNEFKQHALNNPTTEVCGYSLGEQLIITDNVADNPQEDFVIDKSHTLKVKRSKKVKAIYHSHINSNNTFSVEDIKASKRLGIPYHMYNVQYNQWHSYDPNVVRELEGRPWNYVYSNCYNIIQDYYATKLDIKLGDFYLNSPNEWTKDGWNEYLDNLELQGFKRVYDLQDHDLILIRLGAINPNHAAIITSTINNTIIHHCVDRLSISENYDGIWRKLTHSYWRHHSLC